MIYKLLNCANFCPTKLNVLTLFNLLIIIVLYLITLLFIHHPLLFILYTSSKSHDFLNGQACRFSNLLY